MNEYLPRQKHPMSDHPVVKWVTRLLIAAFIIMMFPFDSIIQAWKEKTARIEQMKPHQDMIVKETETLIAKVRTTAQNNAPYLAVDYVKDMTALRDMEQKLSDIAHPDSRRFSFMIDNTVKAAHAKVKNSYPDKIEYGRQMNDALARHQHGAPLSGMSLISGLLTIFKWYFIFSIFAFVVFCLRLYYSQNYSLKEELVLGFKRLVLDSLAWIFAWNDYPSESTLRQRVRRILRKINPKKHWESQFSENERRRAHELAYAPVEKVDEAMKRIGEIPEAAKRKGRFVTMLTSLLATLFSPLITKADEMLNLFLTGSKAGNSLTWKYTHDEEWWHLNMTFQHGGNSILLMAGPKFVSSGFVVKPEVGFPIMTTDGLKVETGAVGLTALHPSRGGQINVWLLTKYLGNFRDRLKHVFTWEFATHYMLSLLKLPQLGLGAGTNGKWFPFARDNPVQATVGPRVLWKASDNLKLEAALGWDPLQGGEPSMVRAIAFVSF